MDRYIPKRHRESAHLEVRLKEVKNNGRKESVCEVTLHLPHELITITEATVNMYAAVDIVETKLKQQIKKYKDSHTSGKMRRHLFRRFRNSPA
jgi:ribosomal subunit interface protein